MTESKFSYTGKLNSTDLFTVRGDSAAEFATNMTAAIEAIKAATELQTALGGRGGMTSMDKTIHVLTNAGLNPTVVSSGPPLSRLSKISTVMNGHMDTQMLLIYQMVVASMQRRRVLLRLARRM